MTDIVKGLRQPWPPSCSEDPLMTEAADEITALRAEVERLNKSRNKWGQKYNKLLEKHRVARAEMANQIQWVKDLADNLIAEEAKTSALRAENERLKDANAQLQEIVNGDTEEEERIRAENERLRAALEKMQRSRDRYRQAWEAEKVRSRAALEEGE